MRLPPDQPMGGPISFHQPIYRRDLSGPFDTLGLEDQSNILSLKCRTVRDDPGQTTVETEDFASLPLYKFERFALN